MNTPLHSPADAVWNGAPWPDDFVALCDRPDERVRAAVYTAARQQAVTLPLHAHGWLAALRRRFRIAFTLTACGAAALLVAGLWLTRLQPRSADRAFDEAVASAAEAYDILSDEALADVAVNSRDLTDAVDRELDAVEQSVDRLESDVADDSFDQASRT